MRAIDLECRVTLSQPSCLDSPLGLAERSLMLAGIHEDDGLVSVDIPWSDFDTTCTGS